MFQIYRNLHQGEKFSIRERGRVIDRLTDFTAEGITFTVSKSGRDRVLRERRKNVHAFVVCQSWSKGIVNLLGPVLMYNPYLADTFMCDGVPISKTDRVAFTGGRCYLINADSNSNI